MIGEFRERESSFEYERRLGAFGTGASAAEQKSAVQRWCSEGGVVKEPMGLTSHKGHIAKLG